MQRNYFIGVVAIILLGLAGTVHPAEPPAKLQPGAILRFEFPDLPDTLASMDSGKKQPAALTVRLPDNYTLDRPLPLFLYLIGGPGGRGEARDLALGLSVIGQRDYICAVMPLFKAKVNVNEPSRGVMVRKDDFDVISRSYRTMLQKLLDTVPNITPQRSVLGGHSNGAHTTGVLRAGQDPFILDHFRAFYFYEGGVMSLSAEVLQHPLLQQSRFLVMMGGKGPFQRIVNPIREAAIANKLDFTFVTMEGYGHEQPPEYHNMINVLRLSNRGHGHSQARNTSRQCMFTTPQQARDRNPRPRKYQRAFR